MSTGLYIPGVYFCIWRTFARKQFATNAVSVCSPRILYIDRYIIILGFPIPDRIMKKSRNGRGEKIPIQLPSLACETRFLSTQTVIASSTLHDSFLASYRYVVSLFDQVRALYRVQ